MGAAPDCANADARSIAARSLRDRVPSGGGCILLPPPPPGGGWCRPLGSYMIPPPPAMGPGLGSTGLTESGSAPRTFDQFEKPNAKCPSNDPGTTLREPAFLARPEDFPYPISPFPAAWSLGKTKSDSLRAFRAKRVTPREISTRILFVQRDSAPRNFSIYHWKYIQFSESFSCPSPLGDRPGWIRFSRR